MCEQCRARRKRIAELGRELATLRRLVAECKDQASNEFEVGDLIGKVVQWTGQEEWSGMWFTARVDANPGGSGAGSYAGTVVDPGNYRFSGRELFVGDRLPNLVVEWLTVMED